MSGPETAMSELSHSAAHENNTGKEEFRLEVGTGTSRPAPLVLSRAARRRCCKTCDGLGCNWPLPVLMFNNVVSGSGSF
jgi:hypothetical protein